MKKLIPVILAVLLFAGCDAPLQQRGDTLDRDTLRAKAFAHAGVDQSDVYDLDEDWDTEGGKTCYELDFEVHGTEYEYVLDAQTGEILHSRPDKKPSSQTEPPSRPVSVQTEPTLITEDEAMQIAFDDAGLNEGAAKSYTIELDRDDHKYEIEFFAKGMEYEYEIDIYTGEILKAEKDRD